MHKFELEDVNLAFFQTSFFFALKPAVIPASLLIVEPSLVTLAT